MFHRLFDVAFERCVALLRTRQYRRGDTIFHQGDLGDSLHVIESGSVKIVLPSPEGEEEASEAQLIAMGSQPKVVAIGETGLDYYRKDGDLDWQRNRFRPPRIFATDGR